jgi:hypothetical protein
VAVRKGQQKCWPKVDPESGGPKRTPKVAAKNGPQKWRPKVDHESGGQKMTQKVEAKSGLSHPLENVRLLAPTCPLK